LLPLLLRLKIRATARPLSTALGLTAVVVSLYATFLPLMASRYPPITDLPFHATFGATFLHYWDPSYHLKEQFRLAPFSHPYMSLYAMIALFMAVVPMIWAVRLAVIAHLLMVPAGLAVLFRGAKKSPLLALLGLPVCWGNLTHWGFINYVGALGLFAMIIGISLLLVERPTFPRQLALLAALVAIYFTHIFRFPFAIAAVIGTGVVMYPARRRIRPLLWPVVAAMGLFAWWWVIRPKELGGPVDIGAHFDRFLKEFGDALTGGFTDDVLKRALVRSFDVAWAVAAVAGIHALVRRARGLRRFSAWDAGVTLVPLCCAAVFLAMFVALPLFIGSWFYVFPREATAAVVVLFGACPDLPRPSWLRVPLVLALSAAAVHTSRACATEYAEFAETSEDLYVITRPITRAPKLFYSIADHTGTKRTTSAFSHLAAYVQAEKGGWLSWSFAVWNHSPVMYRKPDEAGVVTLPPFPRWDARVEKPFYDWILYRQKESPAATFARDPRIKLVDHRGMWWLFHREL
jgi:hypothetical protein